MAETQMRNRRKTVIGEVVSDRPDRTIVVRVNRRVPHPLYGKVVRRSSKYTTHDEKNDARMGDTVLIMETRPLSKTKRWRLVEIFQRAQ
jgi:small subunit ribosomal protein S17